MCDNSNCFTNNRVNDGIFLKYTAMSEWNSIRSDFNTRTSLLLSLCFSLNSLFGLSIRVCGFCLSVVVFEKCFNVRQFIIKWVLTKYSHFNVKWNVFLNLSTIPFDPSKSLFMNIYLRDIAAHLMHVMPQNKDNILKFSRKKITVLIQSKIEWWYATCQSYLMVFCELLTDYVRIHSRKKHAHVPFVNPFAFKVDVTA